MDKQKEPKAVGKKNIYKKSLFEELVKRGNNFSHSMRNGKRPKYQVYVFEVTPKLIEDMLDITANERKNRINLFDESQDQ
ncbi:hypothetical protein [Lysinibacillus sp. FSL W8-0992]|uniref:hypothetical protein n=1 Tax=Lysinibacillus sp. FSL W8-0992 TaxID=2954643 RepID=UPI0030FAEB72